MFFEQLQGRSIAHTAFSSRHYLVLRGEVLSLKYYPPNTVDETNSDALVPTAKDEHDRSHGFALRTLWQAG